LIAGKSFPDAADYFSNKEILTRIDFTPEVAAPQGRPFFCGEIRQLSAHRQSQGCQ